MTYIKTTNLHNKKKFKQLHTKSLTQYCFYYKALKLISKKLNLYNKN